MSLHARSLAVLGLASLAVLCGVLLPDARHVALAAPVPPDRKDLAGDPLPQGATARLGTTRYRIFGSNAAAVSLSPDAKTIAYLTTDGQIASMDAATGLVTRRVPVNKDFRGQAVLVYTADRKRVVVSQRDGLTMFDVESGASIVKLDDQPHGGARKVVACAINGNRIAISDNHRGKDGLSVRVWDMVTNRMVATVHPIQSTAAWAAISADGRTLATWGQHGTSVPTPLPVVGDPPSYVVQVWDVDKHVERARAVLENAVHAAAISPDGNTLAASILNGPVELFDAKTGRLIGQYIGRGSVQAMRFSPDGKWLVNMNRDGSVQIREVATGKRIATVENPIGTVSDLVFTANDRATAWGMLGNRITLWEVPSGNPRSLLLGHSMPITSLAFTSSGKSVISGGMDKRLIHWNPATALSVSATSLQIPEMLRDFGYRLSDPSGTISLSPDGLHCALVDNQPSSPVVAMFDRETGSVGMILPADGQKRGSTPLTYSPDGSLVMIADARMVRQARTTTLTIWEVESGRKVAEFTVPSAESIAAAFSPDSTRLVTLMVTREPGANFLLVATGWDLKTGQKLGEVKEVTQYTTTLAAAAANNSSAVIAYAGRMRTVNYATGVFGDAFDDLNTVNGRAVGPVVFDTKRTRVAVGMPGEKLGNYGVRIFEWPSAKAIHTFFGHTAPVTALAFSPDGKSLASGSQDTTVLLWDLTEKK